MIETRSNGIEVRSDGGRIRGTASPVYDGTPGTEYDLGGGMVERFAPGAFDRHLATNPDVICVFNHSIDTVLGRTPETLRLRADRAGLHYECDLPDTQFARDLTVSIRRGDIRGSSFKFAIDQVEWRSEQGKDIRLIRAAKLFDVSPVTNACYGGSSVQVRGEERKQLEDERDAYRARLETEKRYQRWEEIQRQG